MSNVCMYVSMSVCMYICIYVCMYVCIYVCMSLYVYVLIKYVCVYQRISLSSVRTDRVADIVDQKIATAESMIPSKPDIDDDDDDDGNDDKYSYNNGHTSRGHVKNSREQIDDDGDDDSDDEVYDSIIFYLDS